MAMTQQRPGACGDQNLLVMMLAKEIVRSEIAQRQM